MGIHGPKRPRNFWGGRRDYKRWKKLEVMDVARGMVPSSNTQNTKKPKKRKKKTKGVDIESLSYQHSIGSR